MKPICVPCQRFYRPKKTGFYFIEGMPRVKGARPGTEDAAYWQPYKLWAGDLWECEGCGSQIINGTGRDEIAEHYQLDFAARVQRLGVTFQVNDC